MSTIDLGGSVFIVSGASRGIGWEMADALAVAGARVALTAPPRDGEELQAATARTATQAEGRAAAIVCDNSVFADCERAVEQTLSTFGRLDGLVNNAGLGPAHVWPQSAETLRPFWEADPARWADVIKVNVIGTFNMARAVTPHLVSQRKGRIVNTTTSLATMLREGGTPYGPSKGAIEALTLAWS
jgi:NAD(P)-dependent dehydrogenase (short-subunit alcohol dehydrogenase family)